MVKKSWHIVLTLSLTAIIIAKTMQFVGVTEHLDLKVLDVLFRIRGEQSVEHSPIVIAAVDDASFMSLQHKWPFPRNYFAELICNLREAGARMVVFDIEFTERSLTNPEEDSLLAAAVIGDMPVVFAGKMVVERVANGTEHRYALTPIQSLLTNGAQWAYANIGHDPDGFIRRYTLFQLLGDSLYLPLSLKSYLLVNPTAHIDDVPAYAYNSMLINFYGPAKHFPTYSVANLLDDMDFDLPDDEDTDIFEIHKMEGTFKDKIVFVGATAEELQDNKFTPFFYYNGEKQKTPGVEVHVNALQTLLDRSFIRQIHPLIQLLLVIVFSILAGCCSRYVRPVISVIGWIVMLGLLFTATVYSFLQQQFMLMPITPAIALTISYGFHTIYRVVMEFRQKGFYRRTFQQYISRSVVDTMLNSGRLPQFGGERKTLTVLFSDIRSFTSYCEKYAPEEVVAQLSEYLSAMVDVIFKHEGTLDKFVGDEIMALYGAPYYYENHAERACLTALDMMNELHKLQQLWKSRDRDAFNIGIGINTGKVIVGNLGSVQLFDYTVIGDEVNLGARLEGANKFYGTSIIISEATYEQVKERLVARELDNVCVKGKSQPVRIFELMSREPLPAKEHALRIDAYHRALQLFRDRKWDDALNLFRDVLRQYPDDGPAKLYKIRCLNHIEQEPAEAWNGVYEFMTK